MYTRCAKPSEDCSPKILQDYTSKSVESICGHSTQDAVFHGGPADPLRNRHTGGGVLEGGDFVFQGAVEFRVHPGASAHGAGLG